MTFATAAESSPSRTELRNHPTRSAVAIQGWPSVIFGLPFLAAGLVVMGLPFGYFGDQSARMHAPGWVIVLCGALFATAGVFMTANGLLSLGVRARTARFRAKFPTEPWAWDHPWNPEGWRDSGVRGLLSGMMFVVFWWGLLIPFNYLTFVRGVVPFPFNLVIVLFDLVAIAILGHWLYGLLRLLKYRTSELRFTEFPYRLGRPLDAILVRRGPLATIPELTATLRCVQEAYEIRGTGRNRSHVVVCYELWSERLTIDELPGADFHLRFTPPVDGQPTRLSERPARYWEIEVGAETPGVDYLARFLVPLYETSG
jgi:hypothetical protein